MRAYNSFKEKLTGCILTRCPSCMHRRWFCSILTQQWTYKFITIYFKVGMCTIWCRCVQWTNWYFFMSALQQKTRIWKICPWEKLSFVTCVKCSKIVWKKTSVIIHSDPVSWVRACTQPLEPQQLAHKVTLPFFLLVRNYDPRTSIVMFQGQVAKLWHHNNVIGQL